MSVATLVFNVVGWVYASAIVALGDVELFFAGGNFDIDLSVGSALVAWLTIAGR